MTTKTLPETQNSFADRLATGTMLTGFAALAGGVLFTVSATFKQAAADQYADLQAVLAKKDAQGMVDVPAALVEKAAYPFDKLQQADLAQPLTTTVNRQHDYKNGLTYIVPSTKVVAFRMNAHAFDLQVSHAPKLTVWEQRAAKIGEAVVGRSLPRMIF